MANNTKCEGNSDGHSSPVLSVTVNGERMNLCETCAKGLIGMDIKLRVDSERITPSNELTIIHRIRTAVLA